MSWENYGNFWEIDYIYPQSSFKYTTYLDEDFQKCWSLVNLQPLTCEENIKKSNKIIGDK